MPSKPFLNLLLLALFCGSLGLLGGCKSQSEPPVEERTEPWLRDEKDGASAPALSRVDYRVVPGGELALVVPGRKAKPRGILTDLDGELSLLPDDLAQVSGRVRINLSSLQMAEEKPAPPSADSKKAQESAQELTELSRAGSWTTQALNWLGLGAGVEQKQPEAVFTIQSARDLSHTRATSGAVASPVTVEGHAYQRRKVEGTAVGELSYAGLSVSRTIPVRLVFYFEDAVERSSVPERIELELRGGVSVPLAEYEIRPRDAQGHVLSEQLDIVGRYVGNTAFVSGKMTWEKLRSK